MENLIAISLAALVVLAVLAGTASDQPQPPQVVYIQPLPAEPSGGGCLPLLLLVGVILAALAFF